MSNPLHHKNPKAHERPPIPLPDPDEVRHTFDVAMAKVKERQGFYFALAAIVVLVAVGAIFLLNLGPAAAPSEFLGLWKRADAVRQKLAIDQSAGAELADLEAYLKTARGTEVEGEALWLLGVYHYREAWTADKATSEDRRVHLQKSIDYLAELDKAQFDEFLLSKPGWFAGGTSTPTSALAKQVREDLEWVNTNAYSEPVPNPSVVAVLRTSEGDVHWQFFSELSPEHMKNFVTLARKGAYNDTFFHFVRKGDATEPLGVMGGDPFTFFYNDPLNKQHLLRWGSGGVGYDIAPEGGRYRIAHRPGIVTSQMQSEADWDNGVQFMILTGVDADIDKRHTPFAKVVEGLGVVDKISRGKTAGEHPSFKDDTDFSTIATRDLVVEPATLYKVIVYENGTALPHDFPLDDGERSLATLSGTKAQPLTGDAAYCGRRLRAPDAQGEIRKGLDVPFPDGVDPKDASPLGARVSRGP